MKKRFLGVILATGLSLGLVACGGSSSKYDSAAEMATEASAYDLGSDYDYEEATSVTVYGEEDSATTTTESATTTNRKLIKSVNLSVETKEFDSLVNGITEDIKALNGYIENMDGYYGSKFSSYRSEKSATIVARIPSNKLDDFVKKVSDSANVTNRSESVRDVTLEYVDLDSHKRMLEEEQDRLLAFLEEAETVEEIISLEDRLTDVRYQIDSMESQIRTYDNKVDYSTVTINIQEVVDYTVVVEPELTPSERMVKGFKDSCAAVGNGLRELVIWLVINIPFFILIAIIVVIVVFFVKKADKKSKKKAALRMEKKAIEKAEMEAKAAAAKAAEEARLAEEAKAAEEAKEEEAEESKTE